MAVVIPDKYHLKSIHEDIGLFDRKLAHLMNFEKFDTEAERDEAVRKMKLKRDALVQTAQRLVAEGVEFKPGDLPRSLRPAGEPDVPATTAAIEQNVEAVEPPVTSHNVARGSSGPYAGTSLDWEASVRAYMQKKGRA